MTLIGLIVILIGATLFVRSLTRIGKAIFGPIGAIVFGIGWLLAGLSFGWIAVVAGMIGFSILAVSNPSTPRQKGIARTSAILGLLVTIVLGGIWAWAYSNNEQLAGAQTTLTSLASTTTTSIPPRTDCKEGHVINLPDRGPNYRLLADGIPEQFRNNPEGFRTFVRDLVSSDPVGLYLFYEVSPLQKVDPLSGPADLVDGGNIASGNCYSDRGVRAFNEWWANWKTADLVATQQISHTGGNTGVNGTTPTYSSGVSGSDQSGYDVTYRDGKGNITAQHSVLNRCDQPTHPGVPSKPTGPTDNQPPPATTSTTRPGVTPTTQPPGSTTTTTRPGGTTTTTQPPCCGVTTTTQPPCCVTTTTLTPKDPTQDPLVNTSIPAVVRGPGTTPVGTDPGLPDAPATHDPDSPDVQDDGYCQSCPQQPTSPPTTVAPATTVPPVTAPPTTAPSATLPPQPPTAPTVTVVSR